MRLLLSLFLLTLALAVTACGGGDDETTRSASPESSTITREQLELMALSGEDLGLDVANLQLSDESGYLTSDGLAGDTTDPRDSGSDMEAGGWVATYKYFYEDPTLTLGSLEGGSELDLFEDEAAADAFLQKQLTDPEKLKGKPFLGGFEVQDWGSFPIAGGDKGFGLKVTLRFGEVAVNVWVAGFRVDGLLGTVQLSTTDDSDVTGSMQGLVTKLGERVTAVVDGASAATPMPLPDKPAIVDRPASGPFLDEMALTLDDLPRGTVIDEEAYSNEQEGIEYERSFDLGPGEGDGGPFGVQVNLGLYDDDAAAAEDFDGRRETFLGPDADAFFQDVFSSQPFETSNIVLNPVQFSPAGDDSFAISASYDMPFGSVENVFYYFRVGRVNASLAFSGFTGQTEVAYAETLMAAMAERIEAELASG